MDGNTNLSPMNSPLIPLIASLGIIISTAARADTALRGQILVKSTNLPVKGDAVNIKMADGKNVSSRESDGFGSYEMEGVAPDTYPFFDHPSGLVPLGAPFTNLSNPFIVLPINRRQRRSVDDRPINAA